ncbi:hypothetical protein DYB25_013112 [Aphanomyces astaci]|uniref:Uncharacterized protein n=1 Tax=Aphanomyces astaci TaxID=112090 RepID=A0A397BV01_APHAT|nr:hypothetical protein DYB25_013112 [Aphanomyces astaci]
MQVSSEFRDVDPVHDILMLPWEQRRQSSACCRGRTPTKRGDRVEYEAPGGGDTRGQRPRRTKGPTRQHQRRRVCPRTHPEFRA